MRRAGSRMLEDVEFAPLVYGGIVHLSPSRVGEDVLNVLVVDDPVVRKGPWFVLQLGEVGRQVLKLVDRDGDGADGKGYFRCT